jgi:alginate O-acetyltransferase complex protein AlgI
MLFNSYFFIFVFCPVTLAVYFLLGYAKKYRWSILWLIFASLFFYGWWNPAYLPLILLSITVNYWSGVGINVARRKSLRHAKAFLTGGVIFNLLLLGYYKYANFFVHTADRLFGLNWEIAHIFLPLGISFFTFTQIAYLVDAYHGVTNAYDFFYYAAFVTFFPHLIAGPIVAYRRLMPQFAVPANYLCRAEHLADGLSMFSFGLAKKVIIADGLAPASSSIFDQLAPGGHVPLLLAWFGALAYTFQLYFDFSGYSDMAIGLARMFNIQFPLNFNSPYKAVDIADFWRRWHMTLSHFLRNHLYIPLGGNRKGEPRRYLNLMITMLLGGLWHGAGWTFVFWGGLHGLYLVIHRFWEYAVKDVGWMRSRLPNFLGRLVTFLAVVIAWVFFRANNFKQATVMLLGMMGVHGLGLPFSLAVLFQKFGLAKNVVCAAWSLVPDLASAMGMLALAAAIAFFAPNNNEIFRLAEKDAAPVSEPRYWHSTVDWGLVSAAIMIFSILHLNSLSEFLYFRF